jgi:glycosyltransferase involved in cell wall biosynthesis
VRNPRVTVIIPHYNDLQGLDLCLRALAVQTFPASEFEIVVADNNSPQGKAAVSAAIAGRARLVIVTEKGAGPARNGGVAAARGEILAFTDSDCHPAPTWLAHGVSALEKYDIVGGRVDVFVDDPLHASGVAAFDALFGFDNKAMVLEKRFTVTANQFCYRSSFALVGGFMTGVSEDVEWSHRAQKAGLTLGGQRRRGPPGAYNLERAGGEMATGGFRNLPASPPVQALTYHMAHPLPGSAILFGRSHP